MMVQMKNQGCIEMIRMIKNKKLAEKDKHHISWKNHGIEEYIEHAFQKFMKNQENAK